MGHARVVGAQPYEVLEQLAKHAGARVTHPTGEEM
jgi:hypothetical protein